MKLNQLGCAAMVAIMLSGICLLSVGAQVVDDSSDQVNEAAKKPKPPIPNVAGIWSGSIDDSNGGFGELDMTISQHNRAIGGVWETFFDDPSFNESGVLTGTVVGSSSVKVTLKPSTRRACKARALGLIVSDSEVAGNYTSFGCPRGFSDSGSFDIAR